MRNSRPFYIFYILVGYIFLQFAWWGYHLIELNEEIYALKDVTATERDTALQARNTMVYMEGAVFFILLLIGALTTRKAFMREVELSNQQKNFLMSVSHELQSPLAAIKLNLDTLKKRELSQEKANELLSASTKDVNRLAGLVDNILLATDIESGEFPLKIENLNLSAIIEDYCAGLITRDGSAINPDITQDLYVQGDEQAMISIISNLVENAVKYSGATAIDITLESRGASVVLAVSDQGQGVKMEEAGKIFEKFYRSGNESTRSTKGTGLGLFIAQHLAKKQNGSITVRQNDPKGSIFEVTFPSGS